MDEIIWIDSVNNAKIIKSCSKLYLYIKQEGYTATLPLNHKDDFYKYYKIWNFTVPKEKNKEPQSVPLF